MFSRSQTLTNFFLCPKASVFTIIRSASYSSFNCSSQLEETLKEKVLRAAVLYYCRDKSQSSSNFASQLFPPLLVKGCIQYQLLREHRLSRYRKESGEHITSVHNKYLSEGVTSKAISSRWFCEITAIHKKKLEVRQICSSPHTDCEKVSPIIPQFTLMSGLHV